MTDAELGSMMDRYAAEQRAPEVIWFYRACEAIRPQVIVEIGIKEGGNLKILSTHLNESGLAVGIDPRQEIPWKMDDTRCAVRHIKGSSHSPETVVALKDVLAGRLIDVLFIDGDHSTAGMLADFADYHLLVRSGGIIAVHDIFYLKEVTAAWAALPALGWPRFESPRVQSSIGIGYVVKP
jgi:cephalosporin hydroxylase